MLRISPWHSLRTRATVFTLAVFVLGIWMLTLYATRLLRADMERMLGTQQFQAVSAMADKLMEATSAHTNIIGYFMLNSFFGFVAVASLNEPLGQILPLF